MILCNGMTNRKTLHENTYQGLIIGIQLVFRSFAFFILQKFLLEKQSLIRILLDYGIKSMLILPCRFLRMFFVPSQPILKSFKILLTLTRCNFSHSDDNRHDLENFLKYTYFFTLKIQKKYFYVVQHKKCSANVSYTFDTNYVRNTKMQLNREIKLLEEN